MKILLVEDGKTVAQVIRSRLEKIGHDVFHAEDGKVAFKMFKEVIPDLILMDIEMPIMNGFESTNLIRSYEATRQWAWTPIIFLTASATEDNLITAIEAGADDFIAKSIPEPVLHAKMKAMGRIAALRQRLSSANSKLEIMANLDGLTGLCNRRHMDVRVDSAFAMSMRNDSSFGLLMMDIDNFKKYNDHYGHQEGDNCLMLVAKAINETVSKSNADGQTCDAFAARYGGEEFAVVLPDVTQQIYENIANAIVLAVRQLDIPHEKNANWGVVTISVGGSRIDPVTGSIANIFKAADKNLYAAKENGRNCAVLG